MGMEFGWMMLDLCLVWEILFDDAILVWAEF
jgi:hypothetical protein